MKVNITHVYNIIILYLAHEMLGSDVVHSDNKYSGFRILISS